MSKIRLVEAEKFSIQLPNTRIEVATESDGLRRYLGNESFEVSDAPGVVGLILGRPAVEGDVGRASWVLYESNSVVLRRSAQVMDTYRALAFHLACVAAAGEPAHHLPIIPRTFLLPDGQVWLTDPFVMGELAGLDRRFQRAGITVLPTTVACIDTATGEIVLPSQGYVEAVPSGRVPIQRMLFREIPQMALDGAQQLRLARIAVRHQSTKLGDTLTQIDELTTLYGDRIELRDAPTISVEIEQLVRRGA